MYKSLVIVVLVLSGCGERFRYVCQDPKHWDDAECKRPVCAVNGVCPDQLNRAEDTKGER